MSRCRQFDGQLKHAARFSRPDVFVHACRLGADGIVSKRIGSPYHSDPAALDRSDLHTAVHLPPRTVRTQPAVEGAEMLACYERREDIARPIAGAADAIFFEVPTVCRLILRALK
jgi:hypothetical protein